jgi:hypothetical protein
MPTYSPSRNPSSIPSFRPSREPTRPTIVPTYLKSRISRLSEISDLFVATSVAEEAEEEIVSVPRVKAVPFPVNTLQHHSFPEVQIVGLSMTYTNEIQVNNFL